MSADLFRGLDDILRTLATIADESAARCEQAMTSDLQKLDRALYCLLGVFLPALDRWGRQRRDVIWHGHAPKRADPSFVFVGLLANVINSALACRRLIVTGFDRQARTLFRELTEASDLLLVITADEAFLDLYLGSPEDFDQARHYWDKHLRPWRIRERLRDAARDVGFDDIPLDPEELWRSRWALYAWLSKSAHVDYAALSVEGMAADLDGRHNVNIGGRVGAHSAATLQRLSEYLRDMLILLALFLASRHRWTRDDPDLHEPLLVIRAFAEATATTAERDPGRFADVSGHRPDGGQNV